MAKQAIWFFGWEFKMGFDLVSNHEATHTTTVRWLGGMTLFNVDMAKMPDQLTVRWFEGRREIQLSDIETPPSQAATLVMMGRESRLEGEDGNGRKEVLVFVK